MPHSTIGLSEQETTIGQALQSRGYATALIGKWHLGHHPRFLPTRHGFDVFFGLPYPNDQGAERNILPMHAKDPVRPPIPLWRGDQIEERSADLENLPIRFLNEALKFIDQNKDRPFFLHFANIETHVPWFIPSAYQGKSAAGAYGDAVEFMDWTVGQIMAYVQHLGLERRTLIVFNSDNGPLIRRGAAYEQTYGRFGTVDDTVQHALNGGKHTTWEGGARVACIAYWPGRIAPGGTIDSIAAGFDWPVTFAALAGTRMPDDRIIDGRDLTPLLTGQAGAAPVHEAFYYYHTFRLGGVRSGKWKLLISPTGSGFDSPTPGSAGMPAKGKGKAVVRPQLFDLEADLGETTDVSAREPEVMKRMMELAERARADLGDSATQRRGSGLREPGRIEN
jgi:arylsulfatase A-like enzyme